MNFRKKFFQAVVLSLFLLGASVGFRAQEQQDEYLKLAHNFLQALLDGDYQKATRDFDETMLRLSGPEKLAVFWPQVLQQYGELRQVERTWRETHQPYEFVYTTCRFEKGSLDLRVVFSGDKKISGFQLLPSYSPAEYRLPDYVFPDLFAELEVSFGSRDWELPGSLAVPVGKGPFPALILVHGSGPNDRDETIGPNKPFRDIALGLASRGIVTLRFEKRTKVYGNRIASDQELLCRMTVREEVIEDVVEAVKFLRNRTEVDPKRIFILGHSLGGMLVPRMAEEVSPLEVAGFIIMAGLTRPIEDAYLQQMAYLLSLDGLSEEDRKKLDEIKETCRRIKALTEKDLNSKERYLNAGVAYWLDLKNYDPVAEASRIDRPVLILQGKRDYQVTMEDFNRWQKGLSTRKNFIFKLYPACNHLMMEGQGLIIPDEYLRKAGHVSRQVIDDLAEFILSSGKAKAP